ncbi:SpoIID/LytB domain-containing protein [Knoellia sp. LjRoot47]|uniref:SpoIID/LytB domain-containing protein n=1 Tax=Knoellia sp. LjRoot47 TaxID=3342330 RepID=UPI003ECCB497
MKKFPLAAALAATAVVTAPLLAVATPAAAAATTGVPGAAPVAGAAVAPAVAPAAATPAAELVPAAGSLATQTSGTTAGTSTRTAAVTGPVVGLQGRGFGHGRGMSQWGARGAASQGKTAAQILDFYYPGTVTASVGNPEVRVRLTAMGTLPTEVQAKTGLVLTDGTCTDLLATPNTSWWRASPKLGGGFTLTAFITNPSTGASRWAPFTSTCASFATAKALTFVGDGSVASSVLTLRTPSGNRQYRGGLRSTYTTVRYSGGATTSPGTVNVVPMDSYLRSVVPAEMPASWGLEAVKSQAVAARSYTAARLGSADGFDICDTTACQVYPGLTSSNPEHPNSNAAVAGTSGQVRKYGTAIAVTEFSSTNGGQTVASNLAYQVAKADPYDGVYPEAPDTWSYLTMPVSAIEKAWPKIGTFRSMTLSRDGKGAWYGGRATALTLTGTSGTQVVNAETFRSSMALRSTYFTSVGSGVGSDFAGNGFSDVIARDGSGALWNYPSNGRSGWLPRTLIATGVPVAPEVLAPGDFSGDGRADILTRSTDGALTLRRGDGTGKVLSIAKIGTGWHAFNAVVAPGDLDGDGAVDILARDKAGVLWQYPTNGRGTWKPRISKGTGWGSLRELEAIGDFDGDGGTDLVGFNSVGTLYLLRFSPTGTYLGPKAIGTGFGAFSGFTGMGDVDGDGFVDLVMRDSTGKLWAYRGNGKGAIGTRILIGSGWTTLTFGS